MRKNEIYSAIRNLCAKRNFKETLRYMPDDTKVSKIDLEFFFENYFMEKPKNEFSFSYKVNNAQRLKKKRISNMNAADVEIKCKKKQEEYCYGN